MPRTSAFALAVARPVIRTLIVLNAIYGLVIAGLLVFSFAIEGWPQRPLGFDLTHEHPMAGFGLRMIVIVGVVGAVIVYTVLRRLLRIVESVRDGDPFILDNARHLEAIAWSVAALEGLRVIVASIAATFVQSISGSRARARCASSPCSSTRYASSRCSSRGGETRRAPAAIAASIRRR